MYDCTFSSIKLFEFEFIIIYRSYSLPLGDPQSWPFLYLSSACALRMLHFIWSGGMAAGWVGNLSWLLMNVFMSFWGFLLATGRVWSRPLILACAASEASRSTVWCHYNAVNFLQNPHKRHPIARLLGRLLWFTFCHYYRIVICNMVN